LTSEERSSFLQESFSRLENRFLLDFFSCGFVRVLVGCMESAALLLLPFKVMLIFDGGENDFASSFS
jgi:hypothetical protein